MDQGTGGGLQAEDPKATQETEGPFTRGELRRVRDRAWADAAVGDKVNRDPFLFSRYEAYKQLALAADYVEALLSREEESQAHDGGGCGCAH